MSAMSDAGLQDPLVSPEQIREQTEAVFKKSPCLFQIELCLAQLQSQYTVQDIISTASTGSGKTLSFLMPLLFNNGKITIIVTALNLLGEQFGRQLEAASITAVSVTASNANKATFQVRNNIY
jgi:superfamily II DNA helicase RecQ